MYMSVLILNREQVKQVISMKEVIQGCARSIV